MNKICITIRSEYKYENVFQNWFMLNCIKVVLEISNAKVFNERAEKVEKTEKEV